MHRSVTAAALITLVLLTGGTDIDAAAVPPTPIPQSEIDYLEEAFLVHATTLSNVTEFAYVACDASWSGAGDAIEGTCFAQSGAQILSSLLVHTATDLTVIPLGTYTSDGGWLESELTMTVDAIALPSASAPTLASNPAPTSVAATAPAGPATTFGDGTWIVGTDITPGAYRAPGGSLCYWARLADFSGEEIIANAFSDTSSQMLVEIEASDVAFETNGCGTWEPVG